MKIIITGATGYVGEGVLLECLQNPAIKEVLSISRKPCGINNAKLKELLAPDFLQIENVLTSAAGYDACFYCAGISSNGVSEAEYTKVIYETTLHFASVLSRLQSNITFIYVSGQLSDSTEKGRIMWARIKGKTENALLRLPFKGVYNVRPGMMKPASGQQHVKSFYKVGVAVGSIINIFWSGMLITMKDLTEAMITCVALQPVKHVLEAKDLKALAQQGK